MKQVIVICGPTASGKTALSIQLAKHYGLEIINGDSVQVYKGYDIGSAKIKEIEKEGIHHHLIDIVSPNMSYDVSQFQKDVRTILNDQRLRIVVGGTGLYIKAALFDYHFYEDTFEKLDAYPDSETMFAIIQSFDPNVTIDIHNTKRLQRMYQKVLMGQKPSENQNKDLPLYDILTIYLDLPKEDLKTRLHLRLEKQLKEGFIDEVRQLSTSGQVKDVIGYREIHQMLQGNITLEEAKIKIIQKSLAFAKRQKTWFINQMHPMIKDARSKDLLQSCIKEIDAWKK